MTFFADQQAYPTAPAVSPVAHSPCPHSQAMDKRSPTLSQYGLQYFLPFGTAHSQPGCAHLSGFFSAMSHLLAFVPPSGTGCNPQRCVVIHFQTVKQEGGPDRWGRGKSATIN
jgi:hypothetical protein